MRYGIFSDIHSNLEALTSVFESMDSRGVTRRVCLGDAVGYGASPNECVELIREKSQITLLGNHDSVALGRESSENFNFYARKAIEWTKENISESTRSFLDKLAYVVDEPPLTFVHASPRSPVDWYYITSFDDAIDAFSFFNERICFVGHTHMPSIVVMENEQSFWVSETLNHKLLPNQRVLVNVGSVGQPRDRIPLASWCYCDTDEMVLEIVRVPYNIAKTQERMRENDFAEFLINRLAEGR